MQKNNNIQTNIKIIDIARKWVKTPFHIQGRSIGIGCDCIGLVIGVGQELNAVSCCYGDTLARFDEVDYGLRRDGDRMLEAFDQHLVRLWQKKEGSEEDVFGHIVPGNIIVVHFGKQYYHAGLITEVEEKNEYSIRIIHACQKIGRVVEQLMPIEWVKRITGVWGYSTISILK